MALKTEKRSNSRTKMQNRRPLKISTMIDAIAKLAAAGAIVSGAFIANTYQAKMTSINLVNQREQAESELRANMFSNLIGPVVGPIKDGREIEPDRERLLIELLTLNFHEHFEFKPMLKHVDERLTLEMFQGEMSQSAVKKSLGSLRSVARRVKDRQIAMLRKEGADEIINLVIMYMQEIQLEEIEINPVKTSDKSNEIRAWASQNVSQPIMSKSPDGTWTLYISITSIDWEKQTVGVGVSVQSKPLKNKKEKYIDIGAKFTLTWYDFPLTDNTLLADGNRFSVFIKSMDESLREVYLQLIWFPKGWFMPRERQASTILRKTWEKLH